MAAKTATKKAPVLRDKAGRFPKGQTGNAGGRPASPFTAIVKEFLEADDPAEGKQRLLVLLEREYKEGNARELFDRAYGKPAQSVTIAGDDASPIHIHHSKRGT